jgi:type I restriction enzyme, S subunit
MGNVPSLRFPEFSGEWEENYLKELVDISNEKANPKTHKTSYRCIELENLSSNDGILLGYGDSRTQESIKNKFFKGQILYGKLRPYLRKYWKAEFDGLCSSEIWVLIGKKISNNFLYYIVQGSYFNEIANISTGSKMPRADWNHMREALIKTPSEAEQAKIASFLSLFDIKIEKQAEKVAALEEYKKGLMQKIFSREIRFKDNDGKDYQEWGKCKLHDIGTISSGIGFSETHQGQKGLEISVFKVSDMNLQSNSKYMFKANNYVSKETCKAMKAKYINKPAIIFAKVGAAIFLERKRIATKPFLVDNNMMYLIPNNEINIEFAYYLMNSIRLSKNAQVGALPSYNASDIGIIKIELPTPTEQTKIANFLALFDHKIEKEKEKLDALREQKKGLLQQMFV